MRLRVEEAGRRFPAQAVEPANDAGRHILGECAFRLWLRQDRVHVENIGMSHWRLCFDGYEPRAEGLREALCTVGNGYMATRGATPESLAGGIHYPGTYVAGVYNRRGTMLAGQLVENETLVNLPNWLPVTFRIDGGAWFDIDAVEVLSYQQCLDLRRAVLTRRLRFRDEAGRVTAVTQRRFAHMRLAHVAALDVTITSEDWSGRLEIRSTLDGTVTNGLVERYRDLPGDHLDEVRTRELPGCAVLVETQTNQSRIRLAMGLRNSVKREGQPLPHECRHVEETGTAGHLFNVGMAAGQGVTLEKVVTVFTGRDRGVSEPSDAAARWLARLDGFEALLESHVLAWSHLWDRFRFGLGEHHEDTQRIIRLHMLHLLQTVSPNTADLDVGIPARGLHGEAYRGHVFWDELFVFPVLNLRFPELTRSLLGYRHRRLPEARQAARAAGYAGAMYPWQSGSDGREESQLLHLNPQSGRWSADPSRLQRHVGLAVAYNVWQYYQTTADRDFLTAYGAEMLAEIARFWASIATYDRSRDRYVIRGVIGPDEFHSGYPGATDAGIDNNAYTNVMAVWVIQRAMEALEIIPARARQELTETLALRPEELIRWDHITRAMFVPFRDNGVISQFQGYEDLAELDWDGYRQKYGNIQRLDRILEAEGDDVNRYQVSKQADVLMLFYLLSADELGSILDKLGYEAHEDTIPKTIDYHMARTSHGSTLSAVVHAWVLARAHRDRAAEFFSQALEADVADIQGGTTKEGIHLAAMAGSIDLLQRCFSGLETRSDQLILNPYWPTSLGVLEFSIRYREHPIMLRVTGSGVELAAGAGTQQPITVACRGEAAELRPESTVRFPLRDSVPR